LLPRPGVVGINGASDIFDGGVAMASWQAGLLAGWECLLRDSKSDF